MRTLLAKIGHYRSRFFGYFRLRPLRPLEQVKVGGALSPAEASLFFAMQAQDQRHCFDMALRISAALPGDDVAIRAALLHDVGKRHRRIGVAGRSLATVLGHLGLPMTDAMRGYWDHAHIGADDLRAVGSEGFIVEFAELHAGGVPSDAVDPRWPILIEADV